MKTEITTVDGYHLGWYTPEELDNERILVFARGKKYVLHRTYWNSTRDTVTLILNEGVRRVYPGVTNLSNAVLEAIKNAYPNPVSRATLRTTIDSGVPKDHHIHSKRIDYALTILKQRGVIEHTQIHGEWQWCGES